jgi:hypothetical protein
VSTWPSTLDLGLFSTGRMIFARGPTATERMRSGSFFLASRPASLLTIGPIAAAMRVRALAVAAGNRASGEYLPSRG